MYRLIGLVFFLSISINARENTERYYQEICGRELDGKLEVRLEDRTRVDILTKDLAIEVDFADKWAEGIGQSLHYSMMTKRDAGLILIVEEESDSKYVNRVKNLLRYKSLRIVLYVYDLRTRQLWRLP